MVKSLKIFVISLLLSDLFFLNYSVFKKSPPPIPASPTPVPSAPDICGPACQTYVDTKIVEFKASLPTPLPTPKSSVDLKTKTRRISYLPIPGNGSTLANDWSGLSGTDFYFDTRDYPGLVSIYFEANIHLFNGNGIASARLFDVTHSVGVQGSELLTTNQADTAVESGQVSFYAGKNLVRVQAKSLTADTTVFTSGRLKIIVEN